jgi:hypothetical protein
MIVAIVVATMITDVAVTMIIVVARMIDGDNGYVCDGDT